MSDFNKPEKVIYLDPNEWSREIHADWSDNPPSKNPALVKYIRADCAESEIERLKEELRDLRVGRYFALLDAVDEIAELKKRLTKAKRKIARLRAERESRE